MPRPGCTLVFCHPQIFEHVAGNGTAERRRFAGRTRPTRKVILGQQPRRHSVE